MTYYIIIPKLNVTTITPLFREYVPYCDISGRQNLQSEKVAVELCLVVLLPYHQCPPVPDVLQVDVRLPWVADQLQDQHSNSTHHRQELIIFGLRQCNAAASDQSTTLYNTKVRITLSQLLQKLKYDIHTKFLLE